MRAFLYCRVARDDSFALEHQRFLLQLYAKQAGYTIIGAADEYGSGLTLERPALQKVTEAVVAGKVDVVLVHSLTRIGREWGMTQRYIDLLTRHKVKLLCIRDRLLFDETGAAPILTIKMRSGLCRILRSYKDTPHGPSGETRTPGILLPNVCLNLQPTLFRPLWPFPLLGQFLFRTLLPCLFQETPFVFWDLCGIGFCVLKDVPPGLMGAMTGQSPQNRGAETAPHKQKIRPVPPAV